ncbi:MAG: hypothetical protein DMG24_21325 [Acidobacteria bacterium]|nr:MAG: hypothetical protein DMG24_21325 [Acidobacteriota bacterium]
MDIQARLALFVPLVFLLGFVAMVCVWIYRNWAQLEVWGERLDSFFALKELSSRNVAWSLFAVSFATLYIEIMLIRWIGTEVRIFAFFQNLALIACFLGFGLGCYWSRRRKSVTMTALILLVQAPIGAWKKFLTAFSELLSLSPDAALWGGGPLVQNLKPEAIVMLVLVASVAVALFLLLLVAVMIPLGQWVGFYLDSARDSVAAYSINLLGSVAGIWVFAGMAFLWLPPEYWFGLAFLLLLLIRPPSLRFGIAAVVILAGSIVLLRNARGNKLETHWSPYQKLDVVGFGDGMYNIAVNNTGYMTIANMTPDFLARSPEIAQRYRDESSYDAPFRLAKRCDRVLIVGAGGGNDAAAALRNGAGQVDAVEIDPVIYALGKRLHPDQPYSSPKVRMILNDARAFLRQAHEKYDVVLFGLLDSHTQFSDFSNMRVDNYVYTEEAFREAKRLLKPDGILVLKFEVRAPWTWMGQRFYAMFDNIFGRPPVVFYAPQLGALLSATVFVASNDADLWTRATQSEKLASTMAKNPPSFPLTLDGAPRVATDDWPYVYHRSRSIPRTYLTVSLILLGMALLLVRGVLEPRQASTWHFAFLGAGFLLLETQMISRLALYFGTTWLVNCVALTAILLVLVTANVYVARYKPNRLGAYYVLLIAFLLLNYFFPWQRLPYGAHTVGLLLSVAYALPVFFAGIIFTEVFRRFDRKSSAFGANIVGAVAGGLAQNVSFIVGMKALLLIAALFYTSAGLCALLKTRQSMPEAVVAGPPIGA